MQKKVKTATYKELLVLPTNENHEPLVDVRSYDSSIITKYEKWDMLPYTGEEIYVRATVARKLADAQQALIKNKNQSLKIVYGYRYPAVQKIYFEKRRTELKDSNSSLSDEALNALTHEFVAMPEVAGHPTGGAIDITIVDNKGNDLDMGTSIADYSAPEKIQTFAKGLSDTQKKNRLLLSDLLLGVGFAPFYGEWWHFSYGDREWAHFYRKVSSLYSAIDFQLKK